MTSALEKYNRIFMTNFQKTEDELQTLKYRGFSEWDSIGHMDLISDLENEFDITLDSGDILEFSSYEKGKEILKKYGVDL